MSFFKRIFGIKNKELKKDKIEATEVPKKQVENLHTNSNLIEQSINSIESTSKVAIKSLEELFELKGLTPIDEVIYHPYNIDKSLKYKDDLGRIFGSKGYETNMVILSLTFAFSKYLVKSHNFKLLIDKNAEGYNKSLILQHEELKNQSIYPTDLIINALSSNAKLNDFFENLPIKSIDRISLNHKKEELIIESDSLSETRTHPDLEKFKQVPWMTDLRLNNVSICLDAGFRPTNSLPTEFERKIRPSIEIAKRLHAIKAFVLWLWVPEENMPNEKVLDFVDKNQLKTFMSKDEINIFNSSRTDNELRHLISWKLENAWSLAWYFGYVEPNILGQSITEQEIEGILHNYMCDINKDLEEWVEIQKTVSEDKLKQKEDLFYCLHNAVRSAQIGRETVPKGFDPIVNGGVIHERRHSLTWMLSDGLSWDETDLST